MPQTNTSMLRHLLMAVFVVALPPLRAQVAPAATVSPTELGRYDVNKNGVLDAPERAALEADRAKAARAVVTTTATAPAAPNADGVVELSPFEVVSDNNGYYASNTMSGTRFNSKIEDLGMSISVVTKEQMEDFAMLDVNDIFLYTANTEGTGTFTDLTVDRNGSVADNVELDPANANRVRGIANANISMGNFETMGRTPVDPLNIDGVEVSRGPNANVFGLGSPAGTVNQVPAAAHLTRNHSSVQVRADSYDGYRTSLDVNRVLIKGKLAIRASGAFQHDGYVRKPSGTNTVRYNGMIKYQPFKNTTISGSVSYYKMNGNRPNAVPPRDNVSYWKKSGMPTFDPPTQEVHLDGMTVGTFRNGTGLPDGLMNTYTGSGRSQLFVGPTGEVYWSAPSASSGAAPGSGNQPDRFITSAGAEGVALGHIASQPLFTTTPGITDQNLYDWTSINLAAVNRIWDRTLTSTFNLDQVVFNTPMQSLFLQGSFFREDTQRYNRNQVSGLSQNGASNQLIVDVNERFIDGTPNPYFGMLYIGTDAPREYYQPRKWDTYRAQLAYKLDLTHVSNPLKWLGLHQFTAYDEYKYRVNWSASYRDYVAGDHAWVPNSNIQRNYIHYYVGDNVGYNVDYAPQAFEYGTYDYTWGNNTTGVFNHEPTLLAKSAYSGGAGGASKTILKTRGAVLQSHLFGDRIVTTFGLRHDEVNLKGAVSGLTTAQQLTPDGLNYNFDAIRHWSTGDWSTNQGDTKTGGIVVKPFRRMAFLDSMKTHGSTGRVFASLLDGLSLSYNQSDSFTPQNPAQDLFLRLLPNATGEGKDYGFAFNAFDGKLVIRFNHYINKALNSRSGDANTIAQRVLRHDVASADSFQLFNRAHDWIEAQHPEWVALGEAEAEDRITAATLEEIGITAEMRDSLRFANPGLAATNDITAHGNEVEINFNPTRYWTVAASVTQKASTTTNVSRTIQDYIDLRMPIWTTITDPRGPDHELGTPDDGPVLWWTQNYGGSQTAEQNFHTFVEAPYGVIRETEGKPKPQLREWGAKMSTNLRLAGITERPLLKKFSVGGSLRWESPGSIGYYGVQSLPDPITELDPDKPIYDSAHLYIDAFVTYRTRLFGDKVGATFQLNVRNLQESGRLQPIAAFPDGTPSANRIIDPRQFIVTATFDL